MERMVLSDGNGVITSSATPPRCLDQLQSCCGVRYPSIRAEQAEGWRQRSILDNGKRNSREMGKAKAAAVLTALATRDRTAMDTQNQAFVALLFLYRMRSTSSCFGWMPSYAS